MANEANLDGRADEDEEEVCGGEAGEEGVGRRLEGALLHHCQDDQQVAQHSKCKDHPGMLRLDRWVWNFDTRTESGSKQDLQK